MNRKWFAAIVIPLTLLSPSRSWSQMAAPEVSSFSPTSGRPGTTVSIVGLNFSSTPANNIVYFGGVKATVSTSSVGNMTVVVPYGAGYGPLKVATLLKSGFSELPFTPTFTGGDLEPSSFASEIVFNHGTKVGAFGVGDIDGDGKPDIVVGNYNGVGNFGDQFIAVYRNTSSGQSITFSGPNNFFAGAGVIRLYLEDMNSDGKLDVITVNEKEPLNSISIHLNTSSPGSVTFQNRIDFGSGISPTIKVVDVTIGDVDGDGYLDLGVLYTYQYFRVYRNSSTFNWSLAYQEDDLGFLSGAVMADFNNDGAPDIAISKPNSVQYVRMLENNSTPGSVSLTAVSPLPPGGSQPEHVYKGDFDGDGNVDLLVTDGATGSAYLYRRSNSAFGFDPPVAISATNERFLGLGDIDGDGRVDIVQPYLGTAVRVRKNLSTSGTISFDGGTNFSTSDQSTRVAVADLNADGRPEILTQHLIANENTISILRNTLLSYSLTQSTLSVLLSTVQSGSTVTVALQLKDNNGTATGMGGPTVLFSTPAGGTSTGTFSNFTSNSGFYTALFRGITAGTARPISATINGRPINTTLPTVTVIPGPVSLAQSIVTVSSPNVVKNGTLAVSLRVKDGNGNNLTSGESTVTFGLTGISTTDGTFSSATFIGNGLYSSTFTGTTVGVDRFVAASIDGNSVTSLAPTVRVEPNIPDSSTSFISLSSQSIESGSTATVTLHATNIFATPLVEGGAAVMFSLQGAGSSAGTFGPVADNHDGTYTSILTGTTAGTARAVGATIDGQAITNLAGNTFSVTPGPYSFTHSPVTVNPAPVLSGANSIVRFQAKDINENNVAQAGLTVDFSLSPPGGGDGWSTGTFGPVTYEGNGSYVAQFKGLIAGATTNIRAIVNSNQKYTPVTVIPGLFSTLQSAASMTLPSIPSGMSSKVVLQVKDSAGNNHTSGGLSVSFSLQGPGTSDGSIGAVTDHNNGTYSALITGSIVGTPREIGVTINGSAVVSALPTITVTTGPPAITSLSVGSDTAGATIQIAGSNFDGTLSGNAVFFGTVPATVTSASTTSLDVSVPSAAGYGPVTVVNLSTRLSGVSPQSFQARSGAGGYIDLTALAPRTDVTAGSAANSIAAGDLDGDGAIDIVVSHKIANTISVYRNTGSPGVVSFESPLVVSGGPSPESIGLTDLDGDGKLDIVIANSNSLNISALRNTSSVGTITFSGVQSFPLRSDLTGGGVLNSVNSLALADFNLDGKIDAATLDDSNLNAIILLNTSAPGSVSFAGHFDIPIGPIPGGIAAGDVDGDGKAELLVSYSNSSQMSVFRNTSVAGILSFATDQDFATGSQPAGMSFGDINEDGKPDVIVANRAGSVSIFRNTSSVGTVSLAAKVDVSADFGTTSVTIGDVDGDTRPDVTTSNDNAQSISLLKNITSAGSVSFALHKEFAIAAFSGRSVLADVDGDGNPDVLVSRSNANSFGVFRNTIATYSPQQSLISVAVDSVASGAAIAVSLQLKDLAGSNLEVTGQTVAFSLTGGGTSSGTFGATVDNGNGTYTAMFTGVSTGTPRQIAASINSTAVTSALPTVRVTPGTYSAATSVLSAPFTPPYAPPLVIRQSGSAFTVTLQAKDSAGNNHSSGGLSVAFFRTGSGTSTGSFGSTTDNGDGTYSTVFTPLVSGTTDSIGATIDGDTITTARVRFLVQPGPVSVATSVLTISPDTIQAGTNATINLSARDANGNLVTSGFENVRFFAQGGGSSDGLIDHPDLGYAIYSGNADYRGYFYGRNAGTPLTITATINNVSITTSLPTVTVVSGQISNVNSYTETSSFLVPSGDTVTVTLHARDIFDNPHTQGDLAVAFTLAGPGTSTGVFDSVVYAGNGDYTALFHAGLSGTYRSIVTTINGNGIQAVSPLVQVEPGNYSASLSAIEVLDSVVEAGRSTYFTFRSKDNAGNNLQSGGLNVQMSMAGVGTSTGVLGPVYDVQDGSYRIYFEGRTAGTPDSILVVVNSVPLTIPSPKVRVAPGPLSPAASQIVLSSSSIHLGSASLVTFRAKDDYGNMMSSGGLTVSFSLESYAWSGTSNGSFSSVVDSGNGVYTSYFTGTTAGTPRLIKTTTNVTPINSMPAITVVSSPVITSFAPSSGVSGIPVIIQGTSFNSVQSNNIVYFGATRGTVTSASPTSLTVTVPAGATYGPITVADPTRSAVAVSSSPFAPTFVGGDVFSSSSMDPKADLPAGNNTQSVATADFDGDGRPDLAAANLDDSTVTLLRNIGSPSAPDFTSAGTLQTKGGPVSLAVGDLDADGMPDLIVAHSLDSSFAYFRNTGVPEIISFASRTDVPTSAVPKALAVGDIDGDGNLDVVVGFASQVRVYRSGGSLNFNAGSALTVPNGLSSLAVVDLDGDRRPEIAAVISATNTLRLFRNTSGVASPSFAAGVDYTTGSTSSSVCVGDLNNDAKIDLVTVNTSANSISFFRNSSSTGSTTLDAKSDVATGGGPLGAAIADMNGDGRLDLIVTNGTDGTVSVYVNLGGSSLNLAPRATFTTGSGPSQVVAVDLDADGRFDLAAANKDDQTISGLRSRVDQFSLTRSSLSLASSTVSAGSTVVATLQAKDITGANVTSGGATVVFFVSGSGTSTVTFGPVTDNGNGSYSDTLTGVVAGSAIQISASVNGALVTSTLPAVTVTPGPAVAATSVVTIGTPLKLGHSTTAYLTAKDAQGNAVTGGGATVVFGFASGSNGSFGSTTDHGNGLYSANFTATSVGSASVTATLNGVSVGTSPPPISVYVDVPVLSSLSAYSGNVGTSIVITGDGFSTTPSSNNVYFGSARATVTSASFTSLTVNVPPTALYGPVRVNANGYLASTKRPFDKKFLTSTGTITFGDDSLIAAGSNPRTIAVADYNGDGKPDYAVLNWANDNVTVHRNEGDGTFTQTATISMGSGSAPNSIVTADFNADGNWDVATANLGFHNISVAFGNGDGTFGNLVSSGNGAGQYPQGLAAGDLNNDGYTDLITSATDFFSYSNIVPVLNFGGASFAQVTATSAGMVPTGMAFAHLNGDAFIDAISADNNGQSVTVRYGVGNGTFSGGTTLTPGGGNVATGDFNNDGNIDIVTTYNASSALAIHPGNGNGTFGSSSSISGFFDIKGIVVDDYNGDGKVDIGVSGGGGVSVLPGNGDGSFGSAISIGAGSGPAGLATGDFNSDGRPDLAVANESGANVSIVYNTTSFGGVYAITPTPLSLGSAAVQVTRQDTLLFTNTSTSSITVSSVTASGSDFSVSPSSATIGAASSEKFIVTFFTTTAGAKSSNIIFTHNAAGSPDTVVASASAAILPPTITSFTPLSGTAGSSITINGFNFHQTPANNTVSFGGVNASVTAASNTQLTVTVPAGASYERLQVTANGKTTISSKYFSLRSTLNGTAVSFAAPSTINTSIAQDASYGIAVGNFNADGNLDLVVGGSTDSSVSILLGTGSGTFGVPLILKGNGTIRDVLTADVNNDGNVDVVATSNTSVAVFRGNGNGTFQFAQYSNAGNSPVSLAVGDFNKDGYLDIVAGCTTGEISVLPGNGDGTFSTLSQLNGDGDPYLVLVSDFNGDGNDDIAATSMSPSVTMSVFAGNGNGTFGSVQSFTVADGATNGLVAGDLDNDGVIDIAAQGAGSLVLQQGAGNGSFNYITALGVDGVSRGLGAGDFDSDGKLDLVSLADWPAGGNVSILRNLGSFSFSGLVSAGLVPSGKDIAVGDFNNDGKTDIVTANGSGSGDSTASILLNTISLPSGSPVLNMPSNAAIGIAPDVTLSWYAVSGATSYRVEVSPDSAFGVSTHVVLQDGVVTTSYNVTGLQAQTTYYWRITPVGTGGDGTPTVRTFTTRLSSPIPIRLKDPFALSLDGVNDYVTIPDHPSLRADYVITLEAWINPAHGNNTIIDKGNYNYLFSVRPNGQMGLGLYFPLAATWVYSSGTIPLNEWSHVAVVLDIYGGQGVKFYLNGLLLSQHGQPTLLATNDGEVNIGRQAPGNCNCNYFEGQIDEVRIWNVARTAEQIQASYNGAPTDMTGLAAAYAMSDGSGTTVTDQSGNGHHGTIVNGGGFVNSGAAVAAYQQTSLLLQWDAVATAESYDLQVSTQSDFSSTIVDEQNLGLTSFPISGLSIDQTYYWRVRSARSGDTSGYSMVQPFKTIPPAPVGVPNPSLPPNNATDQSVDLTLSWDSLSNVSAYRLQLATDSTFSTVILDHTGVDSTSLQITGLLNNTQYFWRVSGENAGGFGDFSSVSNFATITGIPESPSLVTPVAGATLQPLSFDLVWAAAAGAQYYNIQLAGDSSFTALVVDVDSVAGTSTTISGLSNDSTYYWRVRSLNVAGYSDYSSRRHFSTLPSIPSVPTLVSPADSAVSQPLSIILSWNAVANATSYGFQLSADSTFGSSLLDLPAVTDTGAIAQGLLTNTRYHWRVRAMNANGSSGYSAARSFQTVLVVAAAPTLASPPNGALDQPTSVVLSWDSLGGADTYRIQFADDITFNTLAIEDSGIAGTNYLPSGLEQKTTYYWRVRGENASGLSPFSLIRSFTTLPPLAAAPSLLAPADSAIHQPTSMTLTWGSVLDAASYRIRVSSDSSFGTTIIDEPGLLDTTYAVVGLVPGTSYYWQVTPENASGVGTSSSTRSFTTLPPVPGIPLLASPMDGATDQATSLTIAWLSLPGADEYRMQVTTDSTFTTLYADEMGLLDTSFSLIGLDPGTTYFWRILGENISGEGVFASPRSFETVPPLPGTPLLAEPLNDAVDQMLTPLLVWNPVSGAASYHVQVSSDSLFSAIQYDQTGISDTSHAPSSLAPGTSFYWRVRSQNAGGTSAFSTARHFLTIPPVPDPPMLSGPADGAVDLPREMTFTWTTPPGTVSFRLEVSSDSSFATSFIDSGGILADSSFAEGFDPGTTYFWRVSASNAGGMGLASSVFRFSTLPPEPPSPQLVSPINMADNMPTTLTVAWNPTPGADSYRLQVSTNAAFAPLTLDTSGLTSTAYQLTGLSSDSTYYWRVNAVNIGGTGLFSSLRTFTTEPTTPAPPVHLTPPDGAFDQPLGVDLVWTAGPAGTRYRLQFASDNGFTSLLLDSTGIDTTTLSLGSLDRGTTYYWRVSAVNAGGASIYSDGAAFTTIPFAPGVPVLAFPGDSTTDQQVAPVLVWYATSGASTYRIQIATDSLFSSVLQDDSTVTDSTFAASTLATSAWHYWRVSATNAGGTSDYSAVGSFRTVPAPPDTPILASPPTGTVDAPLAVVASWDSSVGATYYRLLLATDVDFTSIVADHDSLIATADTLTGLDRSTTYYWQVRAGNAGGVSTYATASSFTTIPDPPEVPVLLAPTDSSSDVLTDLSITWEAENGAAFYHLQVGTDSTFATLLVDNDSLATTSDSLSGLIRSTTYYWRVGASNAGGLSGFSSARQFVTIPYAPDAPVLASPVDNALDQPLAVTLAWNPSNGASSYRLRVATDSAFTNVIADIDSIGGTSESVSGLTVTTSYFWQVSASNPGGTSAYSAARRFVTIPATPAIPVLASPADSAVHQPLTVSLTWAESNGANHYRLQVAMDSAFTQLVSDDDSLLALEHSPGPLSNATTYFWRVRAENAGGSSAFSEAHRFTTVPQVPGSPTLSSPADSSLLQPLTVLLSWESTAGAELYRVQVAIDSAFTSMTADVDSISGTSYSIGGLAHSTSYFWRVSASNAGGASSFSEAFRFSTIPAVPPIPTLASPADSATLQSVTLTFGWNSSVGADHYRLQISSDSLFTTASYDLDSLTATSKEVSGLAYSTLYYWRVLAFNAGGSSAYSPSRSLSTLPGVPAVPVLAGPADSSINQPTTVTLSWETSIGAEYYELRIATDSVFTSIVGGADSISALSFDVNGLFNSLTYFWTVRATNAGGSSTFASLRRFTTMPVAPDVPILAAPADSVLDQPLTLTLAWNAASGASFYRFRAATDSAFANVVADVDSIVDTTTSLSALTASTTYFWHVSATNAGGTSAYSSARRFTTLPAAPGIPPLSSPADSVVHAPLSMSFQWDVVIGAQYYHLQVASDSLFGLLISDQDSIEATSLELSGLTHATTYFWRVRATNAGGSSDFASPRRFTTIPTAPEAPLLTSPSDSAIHQPTALTLIWTASSGAEQYGIRFSTDSAFATIVSESDSLTDTTYQVSGLSHATLYFWSVRASNAGGMSPSSPVWRFTTIPTAPPIPELVSPVDSALQQPLAVTLSWNDAGGADLYQVQVATDTLFGLLVLDVDSLNATSYELDGLATGTTYYWRVKASNVGGSSDYSIASRFTTLPAPPDIPVLVSPLDHAIHQPTTLTLVWDPAARAVQYSVRVATDSSFANVIVSLDSIPGKEHDLVDLSFAAEYYWTVRAENQGGISSFAPFRRFTTVPAVPEVPTLASPVDSAVHQPTTLTLSWDSTAGAELYHLQVAGDSSFALAVIDDDSVLTTSFQLIGLAHDAEYFWRVRASNAGGVSAFASSRRFRTIVAPPSAPLLALPADSAIHLATSLTFSWDTSAGVERYRIQVATDSAFAVVAVDVDSLTQTSYAVSGLLNGAGYYWRVNAENVGGTSPYSATRRFTTIPVAPGSPVLSSPADSALNQPTTLTLTWDAVPGATIYRIQAARDTAFTSLVVDVDTVSTSFTLTGLLPNTRYYWRARASNAGGTSPYAARRTFTTMISTSVEVIGEGVPRVFALSRNYPNPFNPETKLEFSLPEDGWVTLQIYDIVGRLVATVFEGEAQTGNLYRATFRGSQFPSGVYIARLHWKDKQLLRKMLMVK